MFKSHRPIMFKITQNSEERWILLHILKPQVIRPLSVLFKINCKSLEFKKMQIQQPWM
jgi:hypothetical protein